MNLAEISQTNINGWGIAEIKGEPVIKDIELAEKLGYERPRAIRQLIKRLSESGFYGRATPCGTLENIRGNEATVYFLNEKQTLKTISKSETKIADRIMDEVIDVFIAFRKGKLQPNPQQFTMQSIIQMANSYLGIENQVKEIENDVLELKNSSTLDYAQQQKMQKAVSLRVVELRMQHSLAKEMNRKLFAGLWRVLKDTFEVGSYKDIPKVKFAEALQTIQNSTLKNTL